MDLTQRVESFNVDDPSWLGSRHGLGEAVSVTLDTSAFTPLLHYPDGFFKSGIPLGRITATGKYGPYASQTNEAQTVTITGAPTGGTFTLTYAGQTTAAISYNATAAVVAAALAGLSNIGDNDVAVTGGPGPGTAWVVTFRGVLGGTDVAQMTATGSLTGGTTPAVAVTTTTAGGANPAATDGTESLAGFLAFAVAAPTDTAVDVVGAMFDHCKVVNSKLPVPVDAAGRADAAGRIIFY